MDLISQQLREVIQQLVVINKVEVKYFLSTNESEAFCTKINWNVL